MKMDLSSFTQACIFLAHQTSSSETWPKWTDGQPQVRSPSVRWTGTLLDWSARTHPPSYHPPHRHSKFILRGKAEKKKNKTYPKIKPKPKQHNAQGDRNSIKVSDYYNKLDKKHYLTIELYMT